MVGPADGLRPFCASGYEIFDQDFEETGKVVIWSSSPFPPRVGEFLNIESLGGVHELTVATVRTLPGGWTVTCRREAH